MANSIAYTKNYTAVLDEVYKRAACSTRLIFPRCMVRAGCSIKEVMVPKNKVYGLGDYTRNVGYKTGSIIRLREVAYMPLSERKASLSTAACLLLV